MSALLAPCLCLNKHWTPVKLVTVSKAIVLAIKQSAFIMDTHNFLLLDFESWVANGVTDSYIKTTSSKIPLPEIIVLRNYYNIPPLNICFNKVNLAKRDQYECQYCHLDLTPSTITIDHVLPRSKHGKTDWHNCVIACERCNRKKRDRTPEEANMRLLKQPTEPKHLASISIPREYLDKNPSWRQFVTVK